MEKILIENDKLTPEMERIRSGRTQLFRRKGLDSAFTSRENADVILEHENREMYAELIDGKWYWVNGCAECNGKPRDWGTYIECDKHNVCRTCGCTRAELTEAPWGGKNGWQCKPCAEVEHKAEKEAALADMPEEYNELNYWHEDNIKCPYCDCKFAEDHEHYDDDESDLECPRCDNVFTVTANHSVTFTTARKD